MTLHDYVVNYICRGARGGFAASLGDAFCKADKTNQRKLVFAFPDIFVVPEDVIEEAEATEAAKADLARRRSEDFNFMVLCHAKGNLSMYELLRDRDIKETRP